MKESSTIIEVDIDDIVIDKEITIKSIIPLETNDNSLVGEVKRVLIWEDKIVALDTDQKKIFVFDDEGNFIFNTKRGKGPNEIDTPWDVGINKFDSTIFIYDKLMCSFMEMDFNGNVVSSNRIPELFIKYFYPIGEDKFLIVSSSQVMVNSNNEKRYVPYSICSNDFSEVNKLNMNINMNKFVWSRINPIDIKPNETLLVGAYDYNIYEFFGNEYKLKYIFDFGSDGISPQQWEDLASEELYGKFVDKLNPKVGCFRSVIKNDHYLIVDAALGEDGYTFIHALSNQKTYTPKIY